MEGPYCQKLLLESITVLVCLKYVYLTSAKQDASIEECGHNGESATTFPMMISVGDTNSAKAILLERSFSSAKTCMKEKCKCFSYACILVFIYLIICHE